jgi:Na+-translocating ferredoxin:NAD+ oxidoreductase RnfA subunit
MLGVLVAATLWMWLWWIVGVFLWALFIYFTYMIAASKGRSPLLWVVLAIFFPLITIIVLLIIPAKPRQPV